MKKNPEKHEKQFLRAGDAAKFCGVSSPTLRKWVREGLVPAMVQPQTGQFLFNKLELEHMRPQPYRRSQDRDLAGAEQPRIPKKPKKGKVHADPTAGPDESEGGEGRADDGSELLGGAGEAYGDQGGNVDPAYPDYEDQLPPGDSGE